MRPRAEPRWSATPLSGSAKRSRSISPSEADTPANSPPPPLDRNVYGVLVGGGQADVFITYCTNAVLAKQEVPALQLLAVPEPINVSARYGLAVLRDAPPVAQRFAEFVLGPAGQQRLAAVGFAPP